MPWEKKKQGKNKTLNSNKKAYLKKIENPNRTPVKEKYKLKNAVEKVLYAELQNMERKDQREEILSMN